MRGGCLDRVTAGINLVFDLTWHVIVAVLWVDEFDGDWPGRAIVLALFVGPHVLVVIINGHRAEVLILKNHRLGGNLHRTVR